MTNFNDYETQKTNQDFWQVNYFPKMYSKMLKTFLFALIFLLAIFGAWQSFASTKTDEITIATLGEPFRLHVVANSNSATDQATKLMVRDAVVEYLTPKLANATDSTEAQTIVEASLKDLELIAQGIVAADGYGAYAQVGDFDFPAKTYGEIEMPAGEYHALRIILGSGEGDNWWCVLYPPLCFIDENGNLEIQNSTSQTQTLTERTQVEVKSKIAEIFYITK